MKQDTHSKTVLVLPTRRHHLKMIVFTICNQKGFVLTTSLLVLLQQVDNSILVFFYSIHDMIVSVLGLKTMIFTRYISIISIRPSM